jgi:hypothetical protein
MRENDKNRIPSVITDLLYTVGILYAYDNDPLWIVYRYSHYDIDSNDYKSYESIIYTVLYVLYKYSKIIIIIISMSSVAG